MPSDEPSAAPLVRPDPSRGDVPSWPAWTAPAAIVTGLGLSVLAAILVDLVAAAGGSSLTHPPPAVNILNNIVFDLAFVLAALYFATRTGRVRASDFGFRRARVRRSAAVVGLGVLAYYGLTAVYAALLDLHKADKLPSDLGATHSTAALVAASVFVCVIAPIAEEFFFRGFVFGALRRLSLRLGRRELGTWVAAIATGVLFGAAHVGSAPAVYLVPLGFLGFVLCVIRWRTGSLYPCIVVHSANNGLALGVNQLHWNALEIAALILGSWLVVLALTAPLGRHVPALA